MDGGQCTTTGNWSSKVVLCQRGSISFADKVANVTASGGVAAIIYNNVASDSTCGGFIGTLGDGVQSNTPAISLSCADGAALIWSCDTSKGAADIRRALTTKAKDVGPLGRDTSYGYGIVQAKDALLYLNASGGDCTVK